MAVRIIDFFKAVKVNKEQGTFLLFLLSVISHNALNLYGAVLSIITLVQTFAYRWIPTAKSRAVLSLIVLSACCVVAVFASADFIGHFVDMVLVLLVVLVPWTAINLIDFYAIHKGDYDIQSIFQVDGGIYGRYNPQALIAYAVGIVVISVSTPVAMRCTRCSRVWAASSK